MVKKPKKKAAQQPVDLENVQEFKNCLRSILKEALNSWVTAEDDYKNIRSWVGLSGDDVALAVNSKKKDAKNETPLGFYKTMLHRIASSLKKNTQSNKKQVIEKLLECHDYIQSIIKEFIDENEKSSDFISSEPNQRSEDCSDVPATQNKKKRKSSISLSKKSKKKSKSEEDVISDNSQQLIPDEEEKHFMESLPDDIKLDFREVAFSKWGKDWLPVLILSPYDVDVTNHDKWKSKYEKFKNKEGPFEHIVFWYGTKSVTEYYGFAKKSELKSYEDAKKQGLHEIPKRLETKKASGKKLSAPEQNIIDGLGEIQSALTLSKVTRWARPGEKHFVPDSIEGETSQDETQELSEDNISESLVKGERSAEKKKRLLNTKDEKKGGEAQELSEKVDVSPQIQKKRKSSRKKKHKIDEKIEKKPVAQSPESIKSDRKTVAIVDEEFEAELSEKEESEEERFQGKKTRKKGKWQSSNIESTNKSKEKEVTPLEDYATLEEKEFRLNEKEILPIMKKLELSISKKNSKEALKKMQDIKEILHSITPLFILTHPIGKLLKNTRKAFENQEHIVETVRAISQSMKEIYNDKMKRRQEGIEGTQEGKQKQNSDNEEVKSDADVTEGIPETSRELPLMTSTAEPMELQNLPSAPDIIPRKGCSSKPEKQSSVVAQPVADVKASVIIKPKKPKFSLGAMIDGTKQALVPSAAKECKSYMAAPNVLTTTSKKGPPGWLTDALPGNISDPTMGDEVRALGKEFIEAIDADWPSDVLEQINFASFVYHVEKAIFEWSQEDLMAKPRTSNRAPVKLLLKYPENYWVKVRDVVAGLSGDRLFRKPKLVEWMLRGDYETPMDLIKLPGVTFYESMKNLL